MINPSDIQTTQWGIINQLNRILPLGQSCSATPADTPGMYIIDIGDNLLPPVAVNGPALYNWIKTQQGGATQTYAALVSMLRIKAVKQGRMLRQAELPL